MEKGDCTSRPAVHTTRIVQFAYKCKGGRGACVRSLCVESGRGVCEVGRGALHAAVSMPRCEVGRGARCEARAWPAAQPVAAAVAF